MRFALRLSVVASLIAVIVRWHLGTGILALIAGIPYYALPILITLIPLDRFNKNKYGFRIWDALCVAQAVLIIIIIKIAMLDGHGNWSNNEIGGVMAGFIVLLHRTIEGVLSRLGNTK